MKLIIILSALLLSSAKAENVNFLCQNSVCSITLSTDERSDRDVDKYIGETVDKVIGGIDLDGIDEVFSGFEFFQGKGNAKNRIKDLITGDYKIDSGNLLTNLLNLIFDGAKDVLFELLVIIAIVLIASVTNAMKNDRIDNRLSEITHFVCFAGIVGIIASRFSFVFQNVNETFTAMEKQLEICFPIMLTLMSASGGIVSASIYQPQVAFLVKVMSGVQKNLLLPLIYILFIFCIIGQMSEKIKMNKTRDFLKSAFKWIAGLTVVIFNFFVTAQGISSSVYDGVSIKALKYALGNSIPLVGNLVGGGFDVVLASTVLIKNAVGSFALLGIMFTLILPIVKIAIFSLFLRLAAAITEPISDSRISGFLSSSADVLNYFTAVLVLSASSYIITIILMICSLGGAL